MYSIFSSKESIFAVLLLSGTIKAIFPIIGVSGLPDLTLLSAGFVTLIMMSEMRTSLKSLLIERFELIVILTLLYLSMIYSLSYTSSSSVSITKTINFGTMALAFYFPLLVNKFDMNKFVISATLIIFICSIIFLNFYISYLNKDEAMILALGREEATKITAMYLTISWLNGIVLLYYFFKENQNIWIRWSILIISFVFLISAGGRGPLIFTIFILGVYFLYQIFQMLITFKFNRLVLPIIIFISLTAVTIFVVSNTDISKYSNSLKLVDNTVNRLMGLVNEQGGGKSAHTRIINAKFSMDRINQNPFWGYGIGSYGYEINRVDELDYPHNLFLEVWFELGYISLFLFVLFFYQIYQKIDPKTCGWCLALYFYFLLNILKSSSLIDIRMMLGFYAIFFTIEHIDNRTKIKNL